jgi:hypothetical protein
MAGMFGLEPPGVILAATAVVALVAVIALIAVAIGSFKKRK